MLWPAAWDWKRSGGWAKVPVSLCSPAKSMNLIRISFLSALSLLPCAASSDSVVVFNEIMYHPAEATGVEWIELHNQMSVDVDLSRWRLEGGVEFAFAEGTIIAGGSYLVIATQAERMVNALGPLTGRLDNGGEVLRLVSASGRLMNEVGYDDGGDWPPAPDGSGVTLAKVRRDAAAGDAAGWWWSSQVGGTPGEANFPDDQAPMPALVINEVAPAGGEDFWVELYNRGVSDVDLEGYVLSGPGSAQYVMEGLRIGAGKFVVLGQEQLDFGTASGDKLFLYNRGKQSVLDAVEVKAGARARFPDGGQRMPVPWETTPGAGNEVRLEGQIVINEIFYHHRPQFADGERPYVEIGTEWLELYHRGTSGVDLSGWELDGDIRYRFAEGTMLEPGGYLVIGNGGEAGFRGDLPNRSGHIVLRDATGNPADEVRYYDDGQWPVEADGGGSSLELRDPKADNGKAAAWAPSDELARTQWQQIRYGGEAKRSRVGLDSQWRELVVGLLNRGQVLIDDISVVQDPGGANIRMVNNSTFSPSIFGGGALRGWRLRGNHRHSEVVPDPDDPSNKVLKLVATGPTEHMHNHAEITFSGGNRVENGETYEISFRVRPVSGSPQLLTRLYFNRLARTHILRTPGGGGTPGRVNSRREANIGPTMSGLNHAPAVPAADEACVVRVEAGDPDGISAMKLFWSRDGQGFEEVVMASTGGETYEGAIPAQRANAVVQFYVEAIDGEGAISHMPPGGPESRALYQVLDEDRLAKTPLHHFRIIMRPDDAAWIHDAINLMSNDRLGATVIYKEEEIFYEVGVRLKGSERGRVTNPRLGFHVRFPSQQRFRGRHRTVSLDRSEGVNFGQFEMLFNQMMTHSGGIPAEYNDLVHVITPKTVHTGAAELQLARYGDIFLDSQFEDGSEGNLYEYELIYYPTSDDAQGHKRPQPDGVVGTPVRDLGDDKEDYRWNFLLKSNRNRDGFSGLMRYAKLFSKRGQDFQAELEEVVDVDRWLQGMAFALMSGAGDQYGANSQHNGMFYQRPDGKFIFFPHDLDFAFNASRSITENNDLRRIIENDAHRRTYLAHVHNLLTTTFNETYMSRWAGHFGELLPQQNFRAHLNYIVSRARSAKSQVNRMGPETVFGIRTNDGKDFQIAGPAAELEGTGGLNLHRLRHVETGALMRPEWLDLETWRIVVPLRPGANVITLQGIDVTGGVGSIFSPVGKDSVTITNTGSVGPATAENVVISEIMYHPAEPTAEELAAGFGDGNAFEYIELLNLSGAVVDLSDVAFTDGIRVQLDGQLGAGERALVVRNAAAFAFRHGSEIGVIAEWGETRLDNQGERMALERASGEVLHALAYDDEAPWPEAAAGGGASLVLAGAGGLVNFNDARNWRASAPGGSPGLPDGPWPPAVGGVDLVSDLNISLAPEGEVGLAYRRPREAGLTYSVEASADLRKWDAVEGVSVSREEIDDTAQQVVMTFPLGEASGQFVRLKILRQ